MVEEAARPADAAPMADDERLVPLEAGLVGVEGRSTAEEIPRSIARAGPDRKDDDEVQTVPP